MTFRLATATVSARLSGQRGRAIVTAKGHHFIVDSPLTLGGPNEEVNPIDLLLSSLASHGAFMCERIARETSIPLKSVSMLATGSYDPRGVMGEPVDPRIQAIKLRIAFEGITVEQGQALADAYRARCPVYATLSRATPIELEVTCDMPPVEENRQLDA